MLCFEYKLHRIGKNESVQRALPCCIVVAIVCCALFSVLVRKTDEQFSSNCTKCYTLKVRDTQSLAGYPLVKEWLAGHKNIKYIICSRIILVCVAFPSFRLGKVDISPFCI